MGFLPGSIKKYNYLEGHINTPIEDTLILAGISKKSSRYPLFLSFKNISVSDVVPLLNKVWESYNVELVTIRKKKGGFS